MRACRTAVPPECQGAGIGLHFLNEVVQDLILCGQHKTVRDTTTISLPGTDPCGIGPSLCQRHPS
jgi:hypothetical protein